MTGQQKALIVGGLVLAGMFLTRRAHAATNPAQAQAAAGMPALGAAPASGSSGFDAIFGKLLQAVAPVAAPSAPSQSVSSGSVAGLATVAAPAPAPAPTYASAPAPTFYEYNAGPTAAPNWNNSWDQLNGAGA